MTKRRAGWILTLLIMVAELMTTCAPRAMALDGGTLRVNPRNGWKAFEVISIGNNPTGDGFNWSMPGTFDGVGAWLPNASTLRLQINHERSDATISEVDLNLANFQTAISNMISGGTIGGVSFVNSARQAYDRWTDDAGASWRNTSGTSNTSFSRFCSGQSYAPNTFGTDRGFVDEIYITGEEISDGRLFGIDLANRDFYDLSSSAGSASGGIGGMPRDSWENAALLDTGEIDHVALLLSPDGGSRRMKIYIGEKGKDTSGNVSNSFLARNGLAFGSYYYLNDTLPSLGTPSTNGFFDTSISGSLSSSKMEDIDTSPSNPTRAVLGDQNSGLFTFDFSLHFSGGSFNSATSSFSITKIQNHIDNVDNAFGDADNVDWTDATTLNGVSYPEGLIFVNEDTGTGNGEIWVNEPDGNGLTKIADTIGISGASETSGILDVSQLVGYLPGSVVLTVNQGSNSSMSVLINPDATLPEVAIVVDIKPGSDSNPVNLKSKGVLPVAILSTEEFGASEVNFDTLLFGDPLLINSGGTAVSPLRSALEDVSGDGLLDLTLKFRTADLVEHGALGPDTLEGLLTGALLDGTPIAGMDSIRIVPPNGSNKNNLLVSTVPEPSSLFLATLGLLGMGWRRSKPTPTKKGRGKR